MVSTRKLAAVLSGVTIGCGSGGCGAVTGKSCHSYPLGVAGTSDALPEGGPGTVCRACSSASAMASSPAAVGWNGAGEPTPCTYELASHSACPVKSGWTGVADAAVAPLDSTWFSASSSVVSDCSLTGSSPCPLRQFWVVSNGL